MFHSVGASDALTTAELKKPVGDGLPETLEEWIPYNGVIAIKIKLNGSDLAWDVDRVVGIDRVTTAAQAKRGVRDWVYSIDFNERCPNVQYVLDFEHQVKAKAPAAFDRVQYLEQPTARDLAQDRQNTMFEAAKLRPVVIDESLTGLDMLKLAREMGYTGAALKACKGQSQTLLLGGRDAEVQDVFVRAGPDVSRRGVGAFRRDRVPRSGRLRPGSECARIRPRRERGLGEEVPRHLRSERRLDAHRGPRRSRALHGLARATCQVRTLPDHRERQRPQDRVADVGHDFGVAQSRRGA